MYWVNGAGYIGDMFFWRKAPTESDPLRGTQEIDSDVKHRKALFFFSTEAPTKSKPPMMELAELDDEEDEADEIWNQLAAEKDEKNDLDQIGLFL